MAMAPVDESPQPFSDLPDPVEPLSRPIPGAYMALGLLLAMNLFNYIDRQVLAAVEPEIRSRFSRRIPTASRRGPSRDRWPRRS